MYCKDRMQIHDHTEGIRLLEARLSMKLILMVHYLQTVYVITLGTDPIRSGSPGDRLSNKTN